MAITITFDPVSFNLSKISFKSPLGFFKLFSSMLHTNRTGFNESKDIDFTNSRSSLLKSSVLIWFSLFNLLRISSNTLSSLIDALSPVFAALEILSFLLFKVSISFNFNSNSIISLSLKGSTVPSTCVMLLSS